jgi:tRNA(Arg) A34 adenosine deaminase TadA
LAYQESLKDQTFHTDEEMMKVAIEIAARNVANDTGGPFGCAIFARTNDTTKLFCTGANRVTSLNNPCLHGEMVAIQMACKKLQHFSLRHASDGTEYIMCTSCEPCAMCLGGTLWSGVHEMICSAAKSDAEAIGFNEGPVYPESYQALEASGMKVKHNVLQEEGARVLCDYGKSGVIYNS